MRSRIPAAVVVAVVASALLIAACGSKKKAESPVTVATTTTTAAAAPEPPPVAPLTGLPAPDAAIRNRPALVVKIDNADGGGAGARPQLGLNQADVVIEERVEGAVTRFFTIFQSHGSEPVGPIRSGRTTDVALVSQLNHPLYAWSGGNADVVRILGVAPMVDVGYNRATAAYHRRNVGGHVAPHNLYASTDALWALAPPDAGPPPPMFTYRPSGAPSDAAGAKPVGSVHVEFGAYGAPIDWTWRPEEGRFARNQKGTPHVDETGFQLGAANVVIQFVTYHATNNVDVSGAVVPEADLIGEGTCWVLTDGKLIEGTWSKSSPEAMTVYKDSAGKPIALTPGQTWVQLPEPGGASVTG